MSIFQKSVVNRYLKTLDYEKVSKAYEVFRNYYGNKLRIFNIIHLKEENYQEGFLREIFVNVLGYTINPDLNYNLTTEFKNQTDSKKADGAIIKDGKAIGVIELKSTKTPFIESITNQAFNYKHNQPNCRFVITSNFHYLRLYIDNSTEFEEFNLFELTETDFKRFYLFLNKDNIINNITLKLKDETKFHEESITEKFYRDYKQFKDKIFENLIENNPQFDKLTLYKKSQKLLDRFLFIWFAEDCGLVPPNAISRIIDQWRLLVDLEKDDTLYSRFQIMFNHLNVGHTYKNYELPGYNGGLFKYDELLDNNNIRIDDKILLEDCLKLSAYDYNTEVDVNILGHIFEHSLNEIEEITAELSGESLGKLQTKRKKEGIFYTPEYITHYIIENTIGELCKNKRIELNINEISINEIYRKNDKITKKGKELFERFSTFKNWLFGLKILDPACGSGAFLNVALNFLISEHSRIDEQIAELKNEQIPLFDTDKTILEQNIFGVDINDESVEIAKLSLWLRTAKKDRKLSDLNNNIKCGNSLIDNPEIAAEKAFHWNNEFPEIMQNGGFDVVIGNPPYVRAEMILNYKPFFSKNYTVFNGNADLYVYFYEVGLSLLKTNGFLAYITPNKWIQSNYGLQLRQFLTKHNLIQIIDFGELPIFPDAGTFPSIVVLQKNTSNKPLLFAEITQLEKALLLNSYPIVFYKINRQELSNENWIFKNTETTSLIKKLEQKHYRLGKLLKNKFLSGIKTGLNDLFVFTEEQIKQITNDNPNEQSLFRPIIFGKQIDKYCIDVKVQKYIFFPYQFINDKNELIDIENFPNTYKYFFQYKSKLSNRAIIKEGIKKGTHKWFELQQVNKYLNYDLPKIIYPDIALENRFMLDHSGYIPDMTCFIIPSNKSALLGILNSTLFKFLASTYCPVLGSIDKGGRIRYKSSYLAKIPIPEISETTTNELQSLVEKVTQTRLEFNRLHKKFTNKVLVNFPLKKFTNKLVEFYLFDFKLFIKNLKDLKININLKEQDEWEEYFEIYQKQLINLQNTIKSVDYEINKYVYNLYELTSDEIAIVEDAK